MLLAAAPAAAQDFPVTITHAFGETVIESEPQRIVTWGWGNNDALLALGIVPVAMPFSTYGGGENGLHPWVEERLAELGAETPIQLPDTQEIPFEQIAAADPDVIVAVFSGISAEDYALLKPDRTHCGLHRRSLGHAVAGSAADHRQDRGEVRGSRSLDRR